MTMNLFRWNFDLEFKQNVSTAPCTCLRVYNHTCRTMTCWRWGPWWRGCSRWGPRRCGPCEGYTRSPWGPIAWYRLSNWIIQVHRWGTLYLWRLHIGSRGRWWHWTSNRRRLVQWCRWWHWTSAGKLGLVQCRCWHWTSVGSLGLVQWRGWWVGPRRLSHAGCWLGGCSVVWCLLVVCWLGWCRHWCCWVVVISLLLRHSWLEGCTDWRGLKKKEKLVSHT